jgi:hypothetical protein
MKKMFPITIAGFLLGGLLLAACAPTTKSAPAPAPITVSEFHAFNAKVYDTFYGAPASDNSSGTAFSTTGTAGIIDLKVLMGQVIADSEALYKDNSIAAAAAKSGMFPAVGSGAIWNSWAKNLSNTQVIDATLGQFADSAPLDQNIQRSYALTLQLLMPMIMDGAPQGIQDQFKSAGITVPKVSAAMNASGTAAIVSYSSPTNSFSITYNFERTATGIRLTGIDEKTLPGALRALALDATKPQPRGKTSTTSKQSTTTAP